MRQSTDHILTTHVGSLPRSQTLVDALLKKDHGETYDPAEYDRVVSGAVQDAVNLQAKLGIDIPSDGEQSKVSYSTYMMDRLTGFGGDNERRVALDLKDYPEFRQKMARMTGTQEFRRSSCIGPVAVKDLSSLHTDIANLVSAAKAAGVAEAFMNSASPGLVTAFQPNKFYPSHEAYIGALTDAMKEEYKAIVDAGLLLHDFRKFGNGDAAVLGFERVLEFLVGSRPERPDLDEIRIALHGSLSSVFIQCDPAGPAGGSRHWSPITAIPCWHCLITELLRFLH